jgi:DnaJ like chaperone protein
MSSIWGKLVGGAAGFALGGPLGALLGALGGHLIMDRRTSSSHEGLGMGGKDSYERQAIFTMGVVALGAKMSKADGRVTRDEVQAFKEVFRIKAEDSARVGKLFDAAKQDVYGFEVYARQVAGLLRHEPQLLREILWCLAYIAKADGVIHAKEKEFLEEVALIFGVGLEELERITQVDLHGKDNDPYQVLGVSAEADMSEIKKVYRNLVRENHPDRLIAKGVPQEMIDVANQKIAKINDAYDTIEKLRAKKAGA